MLHTPPFLKVLPSSIEDWARAIPILLTTAGCLFITINYLSIQAFNPVSLMFAIALLSAILTSRKWPIASTIIFVSAMTLSSVTVAWQLSSFTVLCCFFLFSISSVGKGKLTSVASILVFFLGIFDPRSRTLETEISVVAVWLIALVVMTAFGWFFGASTRRQQEYARIQAEQLISQRETIAGNLHNSVASQLTFLIMQAEIAAREKEYPIAAQEQFVEIAEIGRTTMSQLRELIEYLRSDHHSEKLLTPAETFEQNFLNRLTEMNFQVSVNLPPWGSIPTIEDPRWSGFLQEFFSEAATNILKYAQRNSIIEVWYEPERDGQGTITIQNRITESDRQNLTSHMSSRIGLDSLTTSASSLGGTLDTSKEGGLWTIRLSLPKKK